MRFDPISVMDSVGIGEMPDARAFGDEGLIHSDILLSMYSHLLCLTCVSLV